MNARLLYISLFVACLIDSCSSGYTPKPYGYMRFDAPAGNYALLNVSDLPYRFAISGYAEVELPPARSPEYWINIDYQKFNAKIFCSYLKITPSALPQHMDECRRLVSQTVKQALAINEKAYESANGTVFGTLFEIEGETASPLQFMLTDSVSRFFRGALYFQCTPNADSLAPYIDYLRKDVTELVESFEWR